MSSVVNKSKNKFVPKAKARPRSGAAPSHSAPAPAASPARSVGIAESITLAAPKPSVPETREKTPTAALRTQQGGHTEDAHEPPPRPRGGIPGLRTQQQQSEQHEAHEPPPRPRGGIPGLRTMGGVIPSASAASEEGGVPKPAPGAQSVSAVRVSGIPSLRASAGVPTAAASDEPPADEDVDGGAARTQPTTKGRPKRTRTKEKASASGVPGKETGSEIGEGEIEPVEEEAADDPGEDSEFVHQSKKQKKTPQKRKPKATPSGESPAKKPPAPRRKRPTIESSGTDSVPAEGAAEVAADAAKASSAAAPATPNTAKKKRAPAKPRAPKGTGKPRGRRRAESPEDGETQEIAVNVVKMKDLCRDMRIGKKSKRFFELQQMDFTKLAKEQEACAEKERRIAAGGAEEEEDDDRGEHETTEERLERLANERGKRTMNAPQMRIVNGQIVLDDESLHIDRRERDAVDESVMEVVEEHQNSRLVNSQTWSKREKVEKWDAASTERFYEALSMFGTDFEIISKMFAGRSRRQLRNKFNNEERRYPARITAALRTRIAVNIEEYSVMADQIFPEPQELEDELQKLREAHEADELAAAGHAVAMEKERQEVANAAMHEGDNAATVEQGKKTRKKKGAKGKAAGQVEEVLAMSREEYEAELAREAAEAEDM